jgi:hypothetical protein
MPFIDSSRGARIGARGSGFVSASIHPKSLLARYYRYDWAVTEDHLTVI